MAVPWADTPYALIPTPTADGTKASAGTLHVATTMALAHNLMIRYLNSIYLQASGVEKTKDISDFLFYCQTWCSTIHEHHEGEEKGFFPRIDEYSGEKGVMEDAVDEHKAFTPGLNDFQEYVGQTKPEEYDGKKIRLLIDAFAPALVKHLGAEISKLIEVGEKFGGDKIQTTFDTFEAELLTETRKLWDPHVIIPAGIGAIDRGFEDGKHTNWPPFPWFVPYLSRFIFSRKYAGSWRFSPCRNFRRKELEFVGKDHEEAIASAQQLL